MFSFLSHVESARGISALFPGISALFPGISAQKNRQFFTQSRAKSAQKVFTKSKIGPQESKKWQFPAPSQEIRPKGKIYIYDV